MVASRWMAVSVSTPSSANRSRARAYDFSISAEDGMRGVPEREFAARLTRNHSERLGSVVDGLNATGNSKLYFPEGTSNSTDLGEDRG